MARPRVLLTGPGGRIGPHLVPAFRERYDLRLLDHRPLPAWPDTVVADLQDGDALRRAADGVDAILHLAATSDEAPFAESLVPNNVVGLYNVLEAAVAAGVRRVVYASSVQTVSGYDRSEPVRADDPVRPVTRYAATKVFGEALGRYYHDHHGLEFLAVRIGAFQPYDSPIIRTNLAFRESWLSPRDAVDLFQRCIDTPDVGFAVIYGTSITARERYSRAPARDLLGYEPHDDVADIPPLPPAPAGGGVD